MRSQEGRAAGRAGTCTLTAAGRSLLRPTASAGRPLADLPVPPDPCKEARRISLELTWEGVALLPSGEEGCTGLCSPCKFFDSRLSSELAFAAPEPYALQRNLPRQARHQVQDVPHVLVQVDK